MHNIVISWIEQVIQTRESIISLAVKQRLSFEGWLKFEIAHSAIKMGIQDVVIEKKYGTNFRADISFIYNRTLFDLALKTATTNSRVDGLATKSIPMI